MSTRARESGAMPLMVSCVVGLLALIAMPIQAEPSAETARAAAGYLTQLLGGLVLVIALILLLAWILRRLPGGGGQGRQIIEILAVRSVGGRERLILIQVGEEQILVGVTPTGMRHIHTLLKNVDSVPAEHWSGDFAGLLNRVRAKGGDQ